MYCTRCGNEIVPDFRFCPRCGNPAGREGAPDGLPRPVKKLTRPVHQKSIAGVCAGFANYLEVDVTLMRIVWLCAAIFWGIGIVAYLICWIVMPRSYEPDAPGASRFAAHPGETPAPTSQPD